MFPCCGWLNRSKHCYEEYAKHVQERDCSIEKSVVGRVRFLWRSKERNVACARLWACCWCDPVCASDSHWHACGPRWKKFCARDDLVHNQLPRSRSDASVICHPCRRSLNTKVLDETMTRKLSKFLILFNNTNLLYFPGHFLSGRVLIELDDEA